MPGGTFARKSIMATVISKDSTTIAYEKTGNGPTVILVNGALGYRKLHGEKDLVDKLSKDFTVIQYDRRGRGESTDARTYAVEREIEDIEALVDNAGGSVYLYGSSSGASLALRAAERLGPVKVKKLALYEPPYSSGDGSANEQFAQEKRKINELIKAGKQGDAVTHFLESRGTPQPVMERLKQSPDWTAMERVGHTLVYDFEVLGKGTIPLDVVKKIAVPTQVMDGEKSFDFVHATADILGKNIPGARRKTLRDQSHEVSADAIAPVLKEFFM
jgi:pimeloyl-ACP methyl ester carboxylesterase